MKYYIRASYEEYSEIEYEAETEEEAIKLAQKAFCEICNEVTPDEITIEVFDKAEKKWE